MHAIAMVQAGQQNLGPGFEDASSVFNKFFCRLDC
jgi:hypothetical protein